MKKFAVGVVLLAALGAACAKAGSDGPVPDANENAMKAASAAAAESYIGSLEQLAVGSIRASSKAAADAYVESLQQSAIDYQAGLANAAMVGAGITNLSGTTISGGELPSGFTTTSTTEVQPGTKESALGIVHPPSIRPMGPAMLDARETANRLSKPGG
jgi:hypothetical protein